LICRYFFLEVLICEQIGSFGWWNMKFFEVDGCLLAIFIHHLEKSVEVAGYFVLMGLQGFFEVVDNLVDLCAFDKVKIKSHCVFGHEFPDKENELLLFKGVPCWWKEPILELSFPAKDCDLLLFEISGVWVVEGIESNPISVPSDTFICIVSILLRISSLFLPG
jgi:hypothetical protein